MEITIERWSIVVCLVAGLAGAGCGASEARGGWDVEQEEGDDTAYDEDATVVVNSDDPDGTHVVRGDGEGCVEIEGDCFDLEKAREESDDPHCEDPDARADVITEDGEVVDVICYPPKDDGTDIRETTKNEEGDTEVPQSENGTIITFDEETDGEPIDQDITIDSERTTIYGNGVDTTIIDGSITVSSNESRIRGVTVTEDVDYTKTSNESSLSFCKIEEDLTVASNGFTGTNCKVFGDVEVTGNGARLINIGVGGEWNVDNSATCKGCYSFADDNEDGSVQEAEVGEKLTCGG